MKSLPFGTMLAITLAAGLLLSSRAEAAVYLVDFNTADGGGFPGGASDWNSFADPSNIANAVGTTGIKDTDESFLAGITLAKAGSVADSGNSGSNVFDNSTGGPSWVTTDGALGNTGAAGDYFFTNNTAGLHTFTMTFGGLTAGNTFSLDVFVSRNGTVNANMIGFYDYSLDNGSTWNAFRVYEKDGTLATTGGWNTNNTLTQAYSASVEGNTNARYMSSTGVLTGSTLRVRTTDSNAGEGYYSGIGAMRLTVVPEPSSFALLLGGFGALLAFRRGNRRSA